MEKLLKKVTAPFFLYWKALDPLVFFWRPNVIKWILTIVLIFSGFRGLIYYPLNRDPSMPMGISGLVIELPYLPGKFQIWWMLLTLAIWIIMFIWSYRGLKEETTLSKTYPITRFLIAWISLLLGPILLGWVVY